MRHTSLVALIGRFLYLRAFLCGLGVFGLSASAQVLSSRVLVVYNANSRDSRAVANYYLAKRNIPEANLCKVKVSSPDVLDESEYESHVKGPIQRCLEEAGKDKILYIVFSYQTPFGLNIQGKEYALDAFISDIWDEFLPNRPATQAEQQPYLGGTQSQGGLYEPFLSLAAYREKPGARRLYAVWRIDAPSMSLAKGLVDKALSAEAQGLTGTGCFDRRYSVIDSVADYSYGAGDWDVHQSAQFARRAGFPVIEDDHEQEFGTPPAPLRCEHAALYAGWYSLDHYNDAFSWNPGAIGIHLDSASAANPRSGTNWAANAIQRGITVTSGAVDEPYLENLPHPDQIFLYLFQGANVGDALLRSTRLLKWRIINIGDPLYCPFPMGAHAIAPETSVILALLPQLVPGNTDLQAVIGLPGPAPAGGLTFSVKADHPNLVTMPQKVTIPAGSSYVRFPISTGSIDTAATLIRISVDSGTAARSNTLIAFPGVPKK